MGYAHGTHWNYDKVKEYINGENGNGCELISTTYTNNRESLVIKCACGEIFEKSLTGFKDHNSKSCCKCSGVIKWNIDTVKEFIEVDSKSGCKLLSKEYTDNKKNLELICSCGNLFTKTFHNFKDHNQRQCINCTRKEISENNHSKNKIYIESLGYELVSYYENINTYSKFTLKDKKGYFYTTTLGLLQSGKKPSYIHTSNPYSIQNIKLWIKINKKTFELVTEKYTKIKEKFKWKCCVCNEIFESTCHSVLNHNVGCPYCVGQKVGLSNCLATKNPSLALQWHSTKNDSLTPYDVTANSTKKVWWLCPECNHEWSATVGKRNGAGRGCPECKKSKGEMQISNFCKENHIDYIPQKGFENLIGVGGGNLLYDFYIPKYNLLVEYNGKFHCEPIKNYKNEPIKFAEERFNKQQEHDRRKREYANKNNIKLLEIWHWDFDNIESILENALNLK